VYGLFSEDIDANVIERHVSKLRKGLRYRLGFDPIVSQRYSAIAWLFVRAGGAAAASLAQAAPDLPFS
jgi:hypothetical protein